MFLDAIERYLEFRRPNTQKVYRRALSDLMTFLGDRSDLNITTEAAMRFLAALRNKIAPDGERTADATLRLKYFALRSVYQHLVDLGLLERNPWTIAGKLISGRQQTQKRPTKLIPFNKVEELLSIPNIRTRAGVRDRAMFALLFGCGLRRSELVALNVGDVLVSARGTLYLNIRHTKAGKRRRQPLPRWAGEAFSMLVSQRKSEGGIEEDPLFPFYYQTGKIRGRLSVETVYRLFRDHCRQLGIKAAPHSARATAATKLLDQGYNDRDVALFLGHATSAMVQTYDKRRREIEENPGKKLDFH
jgi:integrase